MKKIIIVLIGAFFAGNISAQSSFQLGLNFSPSIGWIKPDIEGVEQSGMKMGFTGGLIGDFNISENYSFSTGINIVNTGGELVNEYTKTETGFVNRYEVSQEITLKYIELPLKLKLKTNQIGYLTYFGQFGFGIGVNYDASADVATELTTTPAAGSTGVTTTSKNEEEDVDYKDEINLLRTSLIVGLGAEYNLSGTTSLIFGITFNNGFTNIFNKKKIEFQNNTDKPDDAKAINNYVALNLGVLF